ncbi:phenylalanine ammonia-lyase [Labedella phragmitis]|uniref:Phenylalanine ammonia-lyase n=1 Tax=Labedella phragmitis TaxID=2498849 RepID=A0A3S4A734_9MICO|nr:aromatic amino acid lyase [Labedella phragmitis]RWZ52958.1 phenylalanine ammonia-lyase [Labedella phragmitis]
MSPSIPPPPATPEIVLDGTRLTAAELAAIARSRASPRVDPTAWERVAAAHEGLVRARRDGAVYGANTGVGANRGVSIGDASDAVTASAHAKRLLGSHCAAVGPIESDDVARGAMVVRLNQILAGGSGVSSALARGLEDAILADSVPTLHGWGAIGTADLSVLAELALTLTGDRPWAQRGIARVALADSDALPFMSSSALTIATAAIAAADATRLLRASLVVAALTHIALDGAAEAYDAAVHTAVRRPGQAEVAAILARLTSGSRGGAPARLQDPFGLRVVPQVHAPASESLTALIALVEAEANGAAENPLVGPDAVLHHGQFHLAALAAALDSARTSLYPVLTLSSARLGLLLRPEVSGLRPFLSSVDAGSSGLMITEYVVQDVLSTLRTDAAPVSGGSVSISLGLEEHASFATQGARALGRMVAAAPTVVAVEAVAAVRALRNAPERVVGTPVEGAYEQLADALDPEETDRPLGPDIERAVALLGGLADFA